MDQSYIWSFLKQCTISMDHANVLISTHSSCQTLKGYISKVKMIHNLLKLTAQGTKLILILNFKFVSVLLFT